MSKGSPVEGIAVHRPSGMLVICCKATNTLDVYDLHLPHLVTQPTFTHSIGAEDGVVFWFAKCICHTGDLAFTEDGHLLVTDALQHSVRVIHVLDRTCIGFVTNEDSTPKITPRYVSTRGDNVAVSSWEGSPAGLSGVYLYHKTLLGFALVHVVNDEGYLERPRTIRFLDINAKPDYSMSLSLAVLNSGRSSSIALYRISHDGSVVRDTDACFPAEKGMGAPSSFDYYEGGWCMTRFRSDDIQYYTQHPGIAPTVQTTFFDRVQSILHVSTVGLLVVHHHHIVSLVATEQTRDMARHLSPARLAWMSSVVRSVV